MGSNVFNSILKFSLIDIFKGLLISCLSMSYMAWITEGIEVRDAKQAR